MDVDVYIMLMLHALRVGEMGVDELGERVARPAVWGCAGIGGWREQEGIRIKEIWRPDGQKLRTVRPHLPLAVGYFVKRPTQKTYGAGPH